MGNIRQTYVKRVAIDLVKKYPAEFTEDFHHNRLKVAELTDLGKKNNDGTFAIEYKKMLNRIAGYVTRYKQHFEA